MQQWEHIIQQRIKEVVPFRRNWLLRTGEGEWIAKEVTRPGHLKWWLRVDRELRERGFHAMPPIYSDQNRWIITPRISGRDADYRNREDLGKTAALLAHFHLVGYRLSTPRKDFSKHLLQRMVERLQDFSQLLDQRRRITGKEGELLRTYGESFYKAGVRALKRVAKLPFSQLIYADGASHALTHRDLASHNVLIDSQGRGWLIDFDTAGYDCQLGDLWQLLSRALTEQGWKRWVWNEILSQYERIRPLSSVESALLPELLAFPNEFYREFLGLVQEKRGYTLEKTLPYLEWIIKKRAAWKRMVQDLSYW